MKGRYQEGWYFDPALRDQGESGLVRVMRLPQEWIITAYGMGPDRPTGLGGRLTRERWARLEEVRG